MGTREEILSTIAKAKPAGNNLPTDLEFVSAYENLLDSFTKAAQSNGCQVTLIEDKSEVLTYIRESIPSDKRVFYTDNTGFENQSIENVVVSDPHMLENIDVAVVEGYLGVAENAAVWITEKQMQYRILPFITQHLFVILKAEMIVPLLHDAYKMIELKDGFSVFISGPSKTADIEQSLVIGAHGARSHHLFIIK